MKSPYEVIKKRLVTEKSKLMEDLHARNSNPSLARFKLPKVVFEVDVDANKGDILQAVEEMYKDKGVKVLKVNTITTKGKAKQRGRFRPGKTALCKKAIVTLAEGNTI